MNQLIKLYLLSACLVMLAVAGCKKDSGFTHHAGAAMTVDSFTATSGGVGTEILISGSNYSGDTAQITVLINGHRLKVVNANATRIMAVVPVRCGSGPVIVKIGGDSAASTGIFNYVFSRVVTTLAGNGTAGFADGNGTDAEFNFSGQNTYRSMGIVVDASLNVYVADPGNHCIRKIDTTGRVTTFAGKPGTSGYADGQGTAALFSLPYDLAIDAAGNIWSADASNWDIRKITPDGTATTWAWGHQAPWSLTIEPGTGYPWYTSWNPSGNVYKVTAQWGGTAVISSLDLPAAIRFDQGGNLYVVGNGENLIRKYSPATWTGTIVAGSGKAGYVDGAAADAEFSSPCGLAIDGDGNLYVAGNGTQYGDTQSPDQSVRLISAGTGAVSTFAGSGIAGYADGVGITAAFSVPSGVAVDKNGTVYVLDKNNNRIRKIITQ